MRPSLSERMATLALSTFDALPKKYKPRSFPDGQREWTPLAALFFCLTPTPVTSATATDTATSRNGKIQDVQDQVEEEEQEQELRCISLATGTKCLPASALSRCHGQVLHDCHAEVLALRGFNYWLIDECHRLLSDSSYTSPYITIASAFSSQMGSQSGSQSAEILSSNENDYVPPFEIRPEASIHIFCTTAPCGDASMGLLIASKSPEDAVPWAKDDPHTDMQTGQPLGRGHFSLLGAVRRKPARGDAEATWSKSCTDKLALKQVTGILSFPADVLLQTTDSAFIKTFTVYPDQYDEAGYSRAFGGRGRLKDVQGLGKVNYFEAGILPLEHRRFAYDRDSLTETKTTNLSVVSISGPQQDSPRLNEVLVNGVKQGYRQADDKPGKASIVSRMKIMGKYLDVCALLEQQGLPGLLGGTSNSSGWSKYGTLKLWPGRQVRCSTKRRFITQLGGWISNSGDDDFDIVGVSNPSIKMKHS